MEVPSEIATQEFPPTNIGELAHRLDGIIICVADDDGDIVFSFGWGLSSAGAHVYALERGDQLADLVRIVHPDYLITDCKMPGMQGWQVIEILAKEGILPRTFLVTGHTDDPDVIRVGELDGVTILKKPIDFEELVNLISPQEP